MTDDHRSVRDRLRALGTDPIDDGTRNSHARRMRATAPSTAPAPGRRRFGPLAVGAAAVVGFLAGSTGLAMAGALPDAAQGVAHDVLGAVQVDVPAGREGTRGECVSKAAKIEDPAEKQAAKDACPKGKPGEPDEPADDGDDVDDAPGRSGDAPGRTGDRPPKGGNPDAPGQIKHADDPCRGRPSWAGPMSPEERAERKAEDSRAACEDEPDDEPAVDDVDDVDD